MTGGLFLAGIRAILAVAVCASVAEEPPDDAARRAGSLIALGIPRYEQIRQLEPWIRDRNLGLVLLYRGDGDADLERASREIVAAAGPASRAPLIAIDQEGGSVVRYGPAQLPSAMALGAAGSEDLARRAGRGVGCALRRAGIVMNLAPTVDLADPRDRAGLGTRSLSADAEDVGRLAAAFSRGLLDAGVLPVLKHFPGLGSADHDPHEGPAAVLDDEGRIWMDHLLPYRMAGETAEGVMTAHASYPRWPGAHADAATVSPAILTALLRDRLGFDGLVITDVVSMPGAGGDGDPGELAVRSLEAGADLVLVVGERYAQRVWSAIRDAIRSGRLAEDRVDASLERIGRAKARVAAPVPECEFPSDLRAEIATRAVTSVGLNGSVDAGGAAFAGPPGPLLDRFPLERRTVLPKQIPEGEAVRIAGWIAATIGSDGTLVAAIQNRAQASVIARVRASRPEANVIVVNLGAPQDGTVVGEANAWVFTYGLGDEEQEAAAAVVFDGQCAPGRLPVGVEGVAAAGARARCVSSEAREAP